MSGIDRRTFLRGAAAAAASAGAGLALPQPLRAGSLLKTQTAPPVATLAVGGYRILEIICHGGVSQWDNFWLRPDLAEEKQWGQYPDLAWACGGSPDPAQTFAFGDDELGNAIEWGPAIAPLWDGTNIKNRSRMVTVCHAFDPHEIALSLAVTGLAAGPKSGLGAAIQAHHLALEPRSLPYSYVLSSADIGRFQYAVGYAMSTGQHGAASRPLGIKIGSTALKEQLLRDGMTPKSNALLDYYRDRFRDRMRFQGSGAPVRAPGYESYEAAADALGIAPQLDGFLSASLLEAQQEELCVPAPEALETFPNSTRSGLRLAAHLFEEADARHACVFDRGVLRAPGGVGAPYDTHTKYTSEVTATNLYNLCREIRALVDAESGPRLDLDTTLIAITTEFSRSAPSADAESTGSGHHPGGMATILIGGPIASRAISGALTDAYNCDPDHAYSHTDVQGALRIAAGVDPIGGANFSISQFSEPIQDTNASNTIDRLEEVVLGL